MPDRHRPPGSILTPQGDIGYAVADTRPRLVVHGHWHHGYDTELTWIDRVETQRVGTLSWGAARVVGLGCDGDAAGVVAQG